MTFIEELEAGVFRIDTVDDRGEKQVGIGALIGQGLLQCSAKILKNCKHITIENKLGKYGFIYTISEENLDVGLIYCPMLEKAMKLDSRIKQFVLYDAGISKNTKFLQMDLNYNKRISFYPCFLPRCLLFVQKDQLCYFVDEPNGLLENYQNLESTRLLNTLIAIIDEHKLGIKNYSSAFINAILTIKLKK